MIKNIEKMRKIRRFAQNDEMWGNEGGEVEKKNRILAIMYRLLYGEKMTVSELALFYQVSTKSIVRDIGEIRAFLADNREMVGNAELIYDAQERCYRLNAKNLIEAKDLLCVFKILYGSRAMDKDSLYHLLQYLAGHIDKKESEVLLRDRKNEMEYYRTVMAGSFPEIREKVWLLETLIGRGMEIRIDYQRLDGKKVTRDLCPIAVTFSDYYFYLLACRPDVENSIVLYYRLDRIDCIREGKKHVSLSIEERHQKGYAKLCSQNMFSGEWTKIRFLYTGPSLQAILDKFPTAEIVSRKEGGAELSAMVEYSRGTIMELLSQGSWIRVLAPQRLVEDMEKELGEMVRLYTNTKMID